MGSKTVQSKKCSFCSKVFKRGEHCARHELSHRDEKPFPCQFCHKSYGRKDLVKRHERTIHAELYEAVSSETNQRLQHVDRVAPYTSIEGRPSQAQPKSTERYPGVMVFSDFVIPTPTPRRAQAMKAQDTRQTHNDSSRDGVPTNLQPSSSMTDAALLSVSESVKAQPIIERAMTAEEDQIRSLEDLSGPVPIPGNDELDPSVNEFLNTMTYHMRAGEANDEDAEPPPGKRQRLSSNGHLVPKQTPDTLSALQSGPLLSNADLFPATDLMDIDFAMGSFGDGLFFHDLSQYDLSAFEGQQVNDPIVAEGPFLNASDSWNHEQFSSNPQDEDIAETTQVRLPVILKEKSQNPARMLVDDADFEAFSTNMSEHLRHGDLDLPFNNRRELEHFLNGYIDYFHRHLPLVHLPTISMMRTPPVLILAMSCIGALYRLERKKARRIYLVAATISQQATTECSQPSAFTPSPRPALDDPESEGVMIAKPLWLMQTRALLFMYSFLGKDKALMEAEVARMGLFVTEFRTQRSSLNARLKQRHDQQWCDWIHIEGIKRWLCAMFICSSLLTLIYDIPPGVGITQELEFEVLSEERLWNAPTAEDWQAMRGAESAAPQKTIRRVMQDMISGKTNDNGNSSLYAVSGFTTLMVIHGLNMYAWYLSQFSHLYMSPFSDLSGVASNTLLSNAIVTLARCREVLQLAKPEGIESLWNSPEGPLILNCEAMLRVAYTRLFLKPSMPEGLLLIANTSEERIALLEEFVAVPQERSSLITKVMASMCEAFSVPSKAGYLLVRKAAAINWSVEHAVAGWSCVLLLSKWLHCLDVQSGEVPPTNPEMEIIAQVKNTLDEMDVDFDDNESLAAAVVSGWAPLMTDVCVWGVTATMGALLTDLADVYRRFATNIKTN